MQSACTSFLLLPQQFTTNLLVYSHFHSSVDQKSLWVLLGSLFPFSQGQNQGAKQAGLFPGSSGEESISKLILIVGGNRFLQL